MRMIKRKVFIVERTTVFSEEYVPRYTPMKAEISQILEVYGTEKGAINYIQGYIKGCICACKGKPIMEPYCISEIPSKEDIKREEIRWFRDNDRDEYITYYTYTVR